MLTLTDGTFRTVVQGFDVADIVFTGSGVAGTETLLENQSIVSVFTEALQQGKYVISGGTLTITHDQNLPTTAEGVIVSISNKAILNYSTSATKTTVALNR